MPKLDPLISYPGNVDIFETDADVIIRDRIQATYKKAFGSRHVTVNELARASGVAVSEVIEQDEFETVAGMTEDGEPYAFIVRVPYI